MILQFIKNEGGGLRPKIYTLWQSKASPMNTNAQYRDRCRSRKPHKAVAEMSWPWPLSFLAHCDSDISSYFLYSFLSEYDGYAERKLYKTDIDVLEKLFHSALSWALWAISDSL